MERTCGGRSDTPAPDRTTARDLSSTEVIQRSPERMIIETAFPEPPPDNGVTAPQDGSAYRSINQAPVARILSGCSNQSAPGGDRVGAEIIKLLWEWDPERVTNLTRMCVKIGTHSEGWKTAKGIVNPKQGKPDYRQAHDHRVIALLAWTP